MKRTLFILLAIALILAMMPTIALAGSTINVSDSAGLNTALSTAVDGDTIAVANGNYVLNTTVISKDITIIGESEAGVVFTPAGSTTYWLKVEAGSSLSIKNVTMDGAGFDIMRAIYTNGTLSVENVTIKNILNPGYTGMGISIYQDPTDTGAVLSVKNVTMSNIGRIGIHAKGNTIVDGFHYTGKGAIDCLDYAMEIGSVATTTYFSVSVSNATISDCLGIASVDGSGSAGLYANTYFYSLNNGAIPLAPPIDITFENINITNCSVGVYVGYIDTCYDYSEVKVTNSSFVGCDEDFAFFSKQPSGSLMVSANIYDGGVNPTASLGENNVIFGLDGKPITLAEDTEVTAGVEPTYMIIIPAAVDFGTLIKGSGTQQQAFPVQATGLVIENGAKIEVSVTSVFKMFDQDGAGPVELNYSLSNESGLLTSPAIFATFTGDDIEDGAVSVETDAILSAGSYKGTMDFLISYLD